MGNVATLGALALLFSFFTGMFALRAAMSKNRTCKAAAAAAAPGEMRVSPLASLLCNGVPWTQGAAKALCKNRRMACWVREGVLLCDRKGYRTAPEQFLSAVMAGCAALAAGVGLLAQSAIAALAVPACCVAVLATAARTARDKRSEAVRELVPEALRSIETCLQSGYTLMQTFSQVAKETTGPLERAFSQAAHVLEAGRPASEALSSLRDATDISELSFVAVALQVQHESGGSMKQVLAAARDTIEGEIELKRSLRVHTAQAKLSARIVSVMPLVLVALFSVMSEGFLQPFFESAAGFALLLVAVVMQVAGVLAVRRMLSMEVAL